MSAQARLRALTLRFALAFGSLLTARPKIACVLPGEQASQDEEEIE